MNVLCQTLQSEFDNLTKGLKNVDANIKRLTGRDPTEPRFPNSNARFAGGGARQIGPATESHGRLWRNGNNDGGKRRMNEHNFNSKRMRYIEEKDDSGDDDDDISFKKSLPSSIVAASSKISKTRREAIEEQKSDSKGLKRNRRMFGMILGTLHQFQQEERKRQDQVVKKEEIEKKLEEAAEKERIEVKKERTELFMARKEKKMKLRLLEQKLEIAKLHDVWERNKVLQRSYILTKASPPLLFLPAKHNKATQKLLEEAQKRIDEEIKAKKEEMEQFINRAEENQTLTKSPASTKAKKNPSVSEDEEELNAHEECLISLEPITENQEFSQEVSFKPSAADSEPEEGEVVSSKFVIQNNISSEDFEPIYDE